MEKALNVEFPAVEREQALDEIELLVEHVDNAQGALNPVPWPCP
jgi:hypothetical protein